MSVSALTLANGADLLQIFQQATRLTTSGDRPQNVNKMLEVALQEAKLSEASVSAGGDPLNMGSMIDTYA